MSAWTEVDHVRLATLFLGVNTYVSADGREVGGMGGGHYAGYQPTVSEAPNGDTKACTSCGTYGGRDRCSACRGTGRAGKRFLHVAQKYNLPAWAVEYLARAHWEACRVATALGVPAAFRPHESDGTLRVLEYPSAAHRWTHSDDGSWCSECRVEYSDEFDEAEESGRPEVCPALAPGAGTVEHTDPNLFTIVLWRSHPADLERADRHDGGGYGPQDFWPGHECADTSRLDGVSAGLHIGEIGELVGLGPATPHRVPARPYVQKSIVYFAVPDHAAVLPPDGRGYGDTVGEYLDEWKKRARVY